LDLREHLPPGDHSALREATASSRCDNLEFLSECIPIKKHKVAINSLMSLPGLEVFLVFWFGWLFHNFVAKSFTVWPVTLGKRLGSWCILRRLNSPGLLGRGMVGRSLKESAEG
jgi:hypothetical protein